MSFNKNVTFTVNGMHCGGCASKIKNSVNELGIDHEISVELETKKVNVQFKNEQSTVSQIKEKIIQVGFQVEGIELK